MKNKLKRLSSNVTVIYKYLIPAFFLMVLMLMISNLVIGFINIDKSSAIALTFFSFIFCLIVYPLTKLKTIFYDENHTFIHSGKKIKKILNNNIQDVRRYLFYFYRVFYYENSLLKKTFFLPHITGVFIRFWGKPKSIKKYKEIIKLHK